MAENEKYVYYHNILHIGYYIGTFATRAQRATLHIGSKALLTTVTSGLRSTTRHLIADIPITLSML